MSQMEHDDHTVDTAVLHALDNWEQQSQGRVCIDGTALPVHEVCNRVRAVLSGERAPGSKDITDIIEMLRRAAQEEHRQEPGA